MNEFPSIMHLSELIVQYMGYGRGYISIVMLAFTLMLIIGLFLLINIANKNYNNTNCEYSKYLSNSRIGIIICGIILLVIGLVGIASNLSSFLGVWFHPNVWLINEFA